MIKDQYSSLTFHEIGPWQVERVRVDRVIEVYQAMPGSNLMKCDWKVEWIMDQTLWIVKVYVIKNRIRQNSKQKGWFLMEKMTDEMVILDMLKVDCFNGLNS